ncbi:DNA replication/repair protein RecF [Paracoccaceae bacterium GXU_MW_L88]
MIRELSLSYFRSHRAARLSFDGRPVAIYGNNGAGKTNILEAVSLLVPGRGLRRASPNELVRRPESVGWKITAAVGNHEIETWAEGEGSRQTRIDGKAAPQIALGRILRMLWLIPAMDRLWLESASGRRQFLDRMVLNFVPDHGQAALDYEKAMRERNRLLKDSVRDAGWYGALEARMAEAGAAMDASRRAVVARLIAAQKDAASAFPAADLTLDGREWDRESLAEALAASRPQDMAAGRALQGPHRADLAAVYAEKGMPAAQCSTGEQKALLISLILAAARALAAEGTPPVLLLDEVAAHLDESRRAALYDEICALNLQAFLTGTEAHLFQALGKRAIYLEIGETESASQIKEIP